MQESQKQSLRDRFKGTVNARDAFHSLYPQHPNPEKWLEETMDGGDYFTVDSIMSLIEGKAASMEPSPEEVAKADWIKDIEQELKSENISKDGLLEALVRHVILGDSELMDALKPKLIAVNLRKPRP